jgi:hypothetical protein
LDAEWTVDLTSGSKAVVTRKLKDMNPPPNFFICKIKESREYVAGVFVLDASANTWKEIGKTFTQYWRLNTVLLLPKRVSSIALLGVLLSNNRHDNFRGPNASQDNSADIVARKALSWIKECQTSHPNCQASRLPAAWKPTRLIFVGQPERGLKTRLCNSSHLLLEVAYVTLSNCWGLAKIIRLLSTNISMMLEEVSLSQLTQVFRDAIDLARRLGIDYIWINSLCIIQGSIEDWEHESALMGDVYKYSWCNIEATGFENCLAGMFASRNPYSIETSIF